MRTTALLASALFAALSAACSASETPDDHRGELGQMTFGYDGPGCFGDCSPRQAIAKGAHALLLAKGDDAEGAYHARIASAGLVVEEEGLACRCRETFANGYSEGSLQSGEKCYAPAVKHCSRAVKLRAYAAGPALVELLDATEAVVDRITLVVAEPVALVASFSTYRPGGGSMRPLTAAADGAFETDAPATIDLGVKVHGADGTELHAAASDVTVRSDDTRLMPTYSEGGLATTQAEAGVHHVTATGLGLTTPFVIRVTPELPSN